MPRQPITLSICKLCAECCTDVHQIAQLLVMFACLHLSSDKIELVRMLKMNNPYNKIRLGQ
jgi:hypothetical protein